MTANQFTRILCYVIYVLLVVVSIAVIAKLMTLALKVIRNGGEDESIIKEYEKESEKREDAFRYNLGKAMEWILSCLFFIVFAAVFVFSAYVNIKGDVYFDDMPTVKVVYTDSMSKKHEDSDYLFENNLNDQFNAFDLIFVYKAPKPEDLKVYDVIVYQYKSTYIVHRIIEIQEPNERHPDEYWFKTQGDAVGAPDAIVKESQVLAIYRGESVPFAGTFVLFMQAPIGWLCLLLIAVAAFVAPVLDRRLAKERKWRLEEILFEESQERLKLVRASQQQVAAMGAMSRQQQAVAMGAMSRQQQAVAMGAMPRQQRPQVAYAQQAQMPASYAQRVQYVQPIQHIQNESELPKTIQNRLANPAMRPGGAEPLYVPHEKIIQRVENGVLVRYAPIPGTDPVRYVRIVSSPNESHLVGGSRK